MHAAVCDFVLDCLQNSIEAGASVIELTISETDKLFSVTIKDDGIGMTAEEIAKAVDPFFSDGVKHKERRVGLGLPFLVQAVQQVEGEWSLNSVKQKGTELFFSFNLQHIDTPPVGDISGMFLQAIMFDGTFELDFIRRIETEKGADSYHIKRSEIIEILGDLNDSDSLIMARQFLRSNEENLIEGDK